MYSNRRTSGDIRIDLHIMIAAIQGGNFDIEIREDEGLALEISGRDRRHEGYVHFQFVLNVHGEDTLGRRVLERGLVDSRGAGQAHPGVSLTIDTDHTSPTSDLVPVASTY